MPGTWPPNNNNNSQSPSSSSPSAAANKFGSTVGANNNNNNSSSPFGSKVGAGNNNNNNDNNNSSPFGNKVGGNNNNNTSSSSPLAKREQEERERKQKEEEAAKKKKEDEEAAKKKKQQEEEEEAAAKKQAEEEEKAKQEGENQQGAAEGGDENNNDDNGELQGEGEGENGEGEQQQEGEQGEGQQQEEASPSTQFLQRLADPDEQLQPGLRRLLSTIAPLRPTFAAMLAGDFVVPWINNNTSPPPFDPLAQSSVKKALKLKGDAAMSLRSLAITATKSIVLIGANGFANTIYSIDQMRKIDLVRANRTDPCVLIVDLEDHEESGGAGKKSTAYFVLLTGIESGDTAELAVKTSFRESVPVDVLDKPPEVRMTDLHPLLKRMRRRTEEHDKLIAERSAVLDRIRKLHLQNIARSAVERISVDVEDAPAHERERQTMLNLLVNYVCGYDSRSKGEFY